MKLTQEEIKYITEILELRKWKIDEYLQKTNGFENRLYFGEMIKLSNILYKISYIKDGK